jgi:acetyl-CoA carboxylase biotin carboxylase subunit
MKRLLITNRGEIAIRIMRTAKKLGFFCVVLQSDRESEAQYLKMADEIIAADDSSDVNAVFMNPQKIIELALANKIDLIHPGYGFLSENPDFAEMCVRNKLIFVGPSPELIRNMGLKPIAKEMAMKAGLPLVQGSNGVVNSVSDAFAAAEKIGYPVLLKASAGGGGRGMRIVEKPETMERNFNAAHNEAITAFGNGDLFLEKYVHNPKHIEFQILGDKAGNVIHLGERECSLQRKHQKMIEEAPSSALLPEKRNEMGNLAVKFAKSIGYYSAGTIEFIMDEDGTYYFMEMNTRIQVEHPVTEMITGVDLIEWQFRIAMDEPLSIKQEDVKLNGWAIECRINAEDVQNRFSPETGFIEKVFFPEAENVRIETGVSDGTVITPYFDSMIAKVITHDNDRKSAIKRMLHVLEGISILGVKTTIPFCMYVLKNSDFISGTYTTHWIEENYKPEMFYDEQEEIIGALTASIIYALDYIQVASNTPDYTNDSLSMWVLNKRINK